jgi:predicted HicB family RNase H-like nuclease
MSSDLVRVKLCRVSPRDRVSMDLKLALEGKSLQRWAQEALERLASRPLSAIDPAREGRPWAARDGVHVRHGRGTWLSVRVPPELLRRARLRLGLLGASLCSWMSECVSEYIRGVDLEAAERAVFGRVRSRAGRRAGRRVRRVRAA